MDPDHAVTSTPNRATRRAQARRSRKIAAVGSGLMLATGAAAAFSAAPASADTIVVANLDDSGPGSLRQALADANDGDVIDLTGLSGTITLTSGQLDVEDAVTITGPGASTLAISGNNANRVIAMDQTLGDGETLTITGVTITDGFESSAAGAGLYFRCDEVGSNLVLDGVVITGNTADDLGAGLYFDLCTYTGDLTITNSVISGNTSTSGGGGGIWFDEGDEMRLVNSTVSGNTTEGSGGGGITFDNGNTLTILNSTISGNTAATVGGGLYLFAAVDGATIANSTIANNHALDGGGGGIYDDSTGLTLLQTTISGNTASGAGDGLYFLGYAQARAERARGNQQDEPRPSAVVTPASLNLSGTIVAGNGDGTDDIGTDDDLDEATLATDHSVLGAIDAGFVVTDNGGNQFGITDPGLSPLAANGGPTETMALLGDSVAVDAGPDPVPSFPGNEFDQRGPGYDRVVNGKVDVGAYEIQPPPVVLTPRFPG